MRKLLTREMLVLQSPGPLKRLRPAVPYCPGRLAVKSAVLKNLAIPAARVGCDITGFPRRFGRSKPTPVSEKSCPLVTKTGSPVAAVTRPEADQPPITYARALRLLRRKGTS